MIDGFNTLNSSPSYQINSNSNILNPSERPLREHKGTLDKDDFLLLLVRQLQNQDPLNPMQDRDFIAQMAQFSALEQMYNLNMQFTLIRNSPAHLTGLIGKHVTWLTADLQEQSGIVTGILYKDGLPYAKVGDKDIQLYDIIRVEEPQATVPPGDGSSTIE